MLLLITGASGVGKSTARLAITDSLQPAVEAMELWQLGPIPSNPTIAWRQEMVETAVQRAVELSLEGRHLLLAGDPIAPGEALAAPSAIDCDIAICVLDADSKSQDHRLDQRSDPIEIRHLHHGFADWMRQHAVDPSHISEAITTDSWPPMEWDRWINLRAGDPRWRMTVIDTSGRTRSWVADEALTWATAVLRGEAPVFRAGWFERAP